MDELRYLWIHFAGFTSQVEGVRLFTKEQLFKTQTEDLILFEAVNSHDHLDNKQACHSMETAKMLEVDLKNTIESLVSDIFKGQKLEMRWVRLKNLH